MRTQLHLCQHQACMHALCTCLLLGQVERYMRVCACPPLLWLSFKWLKAQWWPVAWGVCVLGTPVYGMGRLLKYLVTNMDDSCITNTAVIGGLNHQQLSGGMNWIIISKFSIGKSQPSCLSDLHNNHKDYYLWFTTVKDGVVLFPIYSSSWNKAFPKKMQSGF